MTTLNQAVLLIYMSVNGRDGWQLVLPVDVPDWVKHPDVMGRLVNGDMCQDVAQGDKGSKWYRAERPLTEEEKSAARLSELVKDATQEAKRIAH